MVERIKERGREWEPEETLYDYNYRFRQEYLRKRCEGKIVLKGRDRGWQESRQGLHKWFCNVKFWDQQAIPYWSMFIIRIKKHSGKHVHQTEAWGIDIKTHAPPMYRGVQSTDCAHPRVFSLAYTTLMIP